MPEITIIPHGSSGAVILPTSLMESIGLGIGDVVDISVSDRQLILRPVKDTVRSRKVEEITQQVLEQRREAYQRLA